MNTATRTNHEIDYLIRGEEMQCVEIELDPTETAIAEAGAFMMMDEGVQMETIFGDGRGQEKGFFGKLMSAGKRVLTGESLFMTAFTNTAQGKKKVLFASPYPGKIIPMVFGSLPDQVARGSMRNGDTCAALCETGREAACSVGALPPGPSREAARAVARSRLLHHAPPPAPPRAAVPPSPG